MVVRGVGGVAGDLTGKVTLDRHLSLRWHVYSQ